MECKNCGRQNPEDAGFCLACGNRLQQTCPNCSNPNPAEAAFCARCGTRLGQSQESASSVAPPHSVDLPSPKALGGGRYIARRLLGEGGRKRVYLAHDQRLDRDVAVAVIKPEGLDAATLARVRHEAQAMARLGDHPNIVTVHDIGEENGIPFIVSQFMPGGSVEDVLRSQPNHRLKPVEAVRVARHISSALQHAHGLGILHRDLKPGNVWMAADGTAKLGDFGLAVALDRPRLTIEGTMLGTLGYMAPEQALGRETDARSDLYSLGCLLYEMVTGRPPFLGEDAVSLIGQHLNSAPVAPSWHNPEVGSALQDLILKLLEKLPEKRPQSAAEVRDSLESLKAAASVETAGVRQEANPLESLAGGIFVGREKEMSELKAGVDAALAADPSLIMLVGEPGIGKTRSTEELATYAQLRGAQILVGRCYEGEGAPEYWPWVQIIRAYVSKREPHQLLSEMGATGAADIAQVVSEVAQRLPGLPPPAPLDPEAARFRLFDSVTTFLKNASAAQPLMLVLDDLHWADKPSLLLLQFMSKALHGSKILVLGTYRDVELNRRHPLAQALGELAREGLTRRVLLRGLSLDDISRYVEMTAGVAPPERLAETIHRETEGNPFFVGEVVRLLVSEGRLKTGTPAAKWSLSIPQSVREVIGRRLDQLSEAGNEALAVAAVIGREFSLDVLERVSKAAGAALIESLEEAVAARVIAEIPRAPGRYSFSHALVRESLYEELSTTRRVRLHKDIAEVLEELYAGDIDRHLAELAYHHFEASSAGDPGKALSYLERAAERAVRLLAFEDAVNHYERALQVMESVGTTEIERRCELTLALAEAQTSAGELERAKDSYRKAVDDAHACDSPALLARGAIGAGSVWTQAGVSDQGNEWLISLIEESLEKIGQTDLAARARLLARLSEAVRFRRDGRPEEDRISALALEAARASGDDAALASALYARIIAVNEPGHIELRDQLMHEMLDVATRRGVKDRIMLAHRFLLVPALESGDFPTFYRRVEEYADLAEESRLPLYTWFVPIFRSVRPFVEGRLDEARALAEQGLAEGLKAQDPNVKWFARDAVLSPDMERGDSSRVEALIPAGEDDMASSPYAAYLFSDLAWRALRGGHLVEAETRFNRLAMLDFEEIAVDWGWIWMIQRMSEICYWLNNEEYAPKFFGLLENVADRFGIPGFATTCGGSTRMYLGMMACRMKKWDVAERYLKEALADHTRHDTPLLVAHTRFHQAAMLIERDRPGDREEGLAILEEVIEQTQRMDMRFLLHKALSIKLQAGAIMPASGVEDSSELFLTDDFDKPAEVAPRASPDGTVTLVFTDIVDSTRLNAALGDDRWFELLRIHNEIIRKAVKAHAGFEVKGSGDGFMIVFSSARHAAESAIEMQRDLAAQAGASPDAAIRVRIGIHSGEAIKEADDFFGRNVNVAARIGALAEPGEILVSAVTHQLVQGSGLRFGAKKDADLKGLDERYEVFKLLWDDGVGADSGAGAPAPSATTSPGGGEQGGGGDGQAGEAASGETGGKAPPAGEPLPAGDGRTSVPAGSPGGPAQTSAAQGAAETGGPEVLR